MGQALQQAGHEMMDVFDVEGKFSGDLTGKIAFPGKREDTALIAAEGFEDAVVGLAQDTLLLAMTDAGFCPQTVSVRRPWRRDERLEMYAELGQ